MMRSGEMGGEIEGQGMKGKGMEGIEFGGSGVGGVVRVGRGEGR